MPRRSTGLYPPDGAGHRARGEVLAQGDGGSVVKAISLTQPWATLVALREKRIETRSWTTSYRGPIAIHAAKAMPDYAVDVLSEEPFRATLGLHFRDDDPLTWGDRLPRGCIVAVAELTHCFRLNEMAETWARKCGYEGRLPRHEAGFGDFTAGRHGFLFSLVRALPEPIPCRGALGLWEVPAEIAARMDELLGLERATVLG